MPYIKLQRSRPFVTGSWMKSPIKSMDMPPNVWSDLNIDQSLVSNRTRNWVLNMETSSTTTIFNWFPPSDLNISLLQYLHLNLVSMSWKHYGKFGLVVSAMHQPWLYMCNDKFHFTWPTLQRFYMQQRLFLFLHLRAKIPFFVLKSQAYPQKFQIVCCSTYFLNLFSESKWKPFSIDHL